MKYLSLNSLSDFEFHDAQMRFISFVNDTLIVSVKYLNIHKSAKQNNTDTDLEISLANITFENFSVESFEPGTAWRQDESGILYAEEPLLTFSENDAKNKLIDELKHCVNVLEFGEFDNAFYYMDATGIEPWFTTKFSFDSVKVEWDEYCGKSWYVK